MILSDQPKTLSSLTAVQDKPSAAAEDDSLILVNRLQIIPFSLNSAIFFSS